MCAEEKHQHAAELSRVSIARRPEIGADIETEVTIGRERKPFQHLHADLAPRVGSTGHALHAKVRVGHRAAQTLFYTERHGVDHIVVGHRGKNLLQRWLVGSVSRQVIDHASVP